MKKLIEINKVTKSYDGTVILKDFDLFIKDGEFVTLLGPSGCGKTTTLRLIGGFETADSGEIKFDGVDISNIPAHKRELNTVFQNYALFPHLNVFGNVAFGLKNKKMPKAQIEIEVKEALRMVKLEGYENRTIDKLSGGQKQRIAIARAIVNKPKLLLLDEPLSALDLKLRQEMQYELKEMQKELGITFIFVTHDQEEALTMSDTVVVMYDGDIQQMGTPQDIYNEPVNRFVCRFIGESNIIPGVYKGNKRVEFLGREFECVDENFEVNEKVDVVVRPEDFDLVAVNEAPIKGKVTSSVFKGVHNELCVDINGVEHIVHTYENVKVGDEIGLSVDPYEIHLMKLSEDIDLHLDPHHIHNEE